MHGIAIELKEITGGMTVTKERLDTFETICYCRRPFNAHTYERHRQADRHNAFLSSSSAAATAAFRHRMMNTITKSDDYIIIAIEITN